MATPLDSGQVKLRLRCRDGLVVAADVASARPAVSRFLRGLPADKAAAMVPLLFSLCGKAQGRAARLALAAARGEAVPPHRDEAVAAEIAGEHLWRLLVDWPQRVGLAAEEALFVEGRRRLNQPGFGDWAGQRLRDPFGRLLAAVAAAAEPPPGEARCLPPLDAAASLAAWPRLDEAFAAAPTWDGAAAETGALARRPGAATGRPILDRVRARMDELLDMSPGRVSAVPVAGGIGRSLVETARGLLMHEVSLEGERVADYVIAAPTEWNFHPAGPLAAWLRGLPAAAAEELAPRAVLALDPCVPWTLEVGGTDP